MPRLHDTLLRSQAQNTSIRSRPHVSLATKKALLQLAECELGQLRHTAMTSQQRVQRVHQRLVDAYQLRCEAESRLLVTGNVTRNVTRKVTHSDWR